MRIPEVSDLVPYVTEDGRLTIEGMKLLRQVVAVLRDHEARVQALEP